MPNPNTEAVMTLQSQSVQTLCSILLQCLSGPLSPVLWVELYSPKRYIEVLPPVLQNMTLFRNRFTADVISYDEVTLE